MHDGGAGARLAPGAAQTGRGRTDGKAVRIEAAGEARDNKGI